MRHKRLYSTVLSAAMLLSMLAVPGMAADGSAGSLDSVVTVKARENQAPSVAISMETVTNETAELTVMLQNLPSLGIFRVVQLDAGAQYDPKQLNDYPSLHFSLLSNLREGENTILLTEKPSAGKQLIAVIRDSSGDMTDYPSAPVTVAAAQTSGKMPLEVLAGCSVTMLDNSVPRTEPFRQERTVIGYSVTLDESIESCRLAVYAYPGNTGFDPDSNVTKRLGGCDVSNGSVGTVEVDLTAVPVGYKVILGLYVCLDGNDFYRTVSSPQAPEIVDESGEGFRDYVYPDATIDETELSAGDTSMHISLTGDERLFQAARDGKISITVAVSQYPADEEFDFEGANQISLVRNISATEPFSHREVVFTDEPLRAGYKVRAVVYWSQNVELFVPKGNDYESVFHKPDDSVLVASPAAVRLPDSISDDTKEIAVEISGNLPENTGLLLKQFAADASVSYDTGTILGSAWNIAPGTVTITPLGNLTAGCKVVAFLLSGGEPITQTAPVTVTSIPDFSVAFSGVLTAETEDITFSVSPKAGMENTNLNIVGLCRVDENGRTDITSADSYVVRAFMQTPGEITLSGISGLQAGERVRFVLRYFAADGSMCTVESADYTIVAPLAENSIVLHETAFTTDSTTATVTVSGCDTYLGDMLRLTVGPVSTNNYADGRDRLGAGQTYTGSGTYTFTFENARLNAGDTVQAYLYHYDLENDRTYYLYSNAVEIAQGDTGTETPGEAEVSIVTRDVTAETKAVYVAADFTGSALVALYTYEGEEFVLADRYEYAAIKYLASAPASSERLDFSMPLTAGEKLIAVIYAGGIEGEMIAQSTPVDIAPAPARETPVAYIRDQKITAGLTRINVTLTCDERTQNARYTLYQFTGETLDRETAEVIAAGNLSGSSLNALYVGVGRLKADSKLQLVLNADGTEALSNVVAVLPSPDWGTPYVAFAESAVKADGESIKVSVDYSDEYLSMGDEFYCDITIYTFPANYTDQQVEDLELWENFSVCRSIAKVNSRYGEETRGELVVPIRDSATLNAEDRLFIKLRLPHVEWEGEEVDYVSASVPIIGADETVAQPLVLLYHLSEDTSLGQRLRTVLTELGIGAKDVTDDQLNEKVGYLAGRDGYVPAEEAYTGTGVDVQFMLMANFPEALLDRFLAAMTENGISIGHKAVTTDYNVEYAFHELIDDIADEHQVFQALLELDKLINTAQALSEAEYGQSPDWNALQTAITAGRGVLSSYEPSLEDLQSAIATLKTVYLSVSGRTELTGTAVISAIRQEDGRYTLTASVKDGDRTDYIFSWNTGETGASLSDIPGEKLITYIVTVTAEDALGKLTAQLEVPHAPQAVIAPETDRITVTVSAEAADNCPAPDTYLVSLYKNSELVAAKTVTENVVLFSGLSAATEYTVKLTAVNIVGTSDTALFTVSTASPGASYPYVEIKGSNVPLAKTPMSFIDVQRGEWYYDAVKYVFDEGLMSGVSDTVFQPNAVTSRGMIVTILWNLAGKPDAGDFAFSDVPVDAWYAEAVAWAVGKGIVFGYDSANFGPDDPITREQLAAILYRYAGSPAVQTRLLFEDTDAISSYATEAVSWAVNMGIMSGKGDDILDPLNGATRAEAAAMLQRFTET